MVDKDDNSTIVWRSSVCVSNSILNTYYHACCILQVDCTGFIKMKVMSEYRQLIESQSDKLTGTSKVNLH